MQIDLIADTVCPWCFIGKQRLESALERAGIHTVALHWRPYQLNPGLADGGRDRQSYLAEKFGGAERAERIYREIAEVGAGLGLDFRFDLIERTPNTVNSHRLIYYAARKGLQNDMVDALLRGYFMEGRDLGQLATLADIAEEIGLARPDVLGYLISGEDTGAVLEDDERARALGITGVPCFIIDRKYAISGAQSPEVFAQVFDLALMDRAQIQAAQ